MSAQSPFIDWFVIAMSALAAAGSRLEADVRARRSGAEFRASLLHPVLFACAVTLGPVRAALPATCAGVCRAFGSDEPRLPVHRILHDLFCPLFATSTSSVAFVLCGGNTAWPQSVDSLPALACAGAVYALTSALLFGLARRVSNEETCAPAVRRPVASGWLTCLLAGYALAVFCASAPVYAVYAISVGSALTAWALISVDRHKPVTASQTDTLDQPVAHDSPSFIDDATGLANRRYLDLFLERELGRSERLNKALSVAVFNVDGFRQLDEGAAREVMSDLGDRLAIGIREYDIAALHSDGRLVVVFPETPFETALEVVERLRGSVSAAGLAISVGLATYPDHAADAQELINAAHYALNRGRSEGADRVYYPQNLAKAS